MITFKSIVELVKDAAEDPENVVQPAGTVNWEFVEADCVFAFNEAGEPLPEDWMSIFDDAVEAYLAASH